jgi:hypothetical protein
MNSRLAGIRVFIRIPQVAFISKQICIGDFDKFAFLCTQLSYVYCVTFLLLSLHYHAKVIAVNNSI